MSAQIFSNVGVSFQSALGVAKTITGITKAAPGVLSATHDFANGDYVILTIQGMQQLNGKIFRVCNVVGTTTFQLEGLSGGTGISTVNYDSFSSGSVQKITFGNTLNTVADLEFSGGDFDKQDASVIHASVKREMQGLAAPISIAMTHNWDLTDLGQQKLLEYSENRTETAFKVRTGAGTIIVFNGTVGYIGAPNAKFGEVVKSPGTISLTSTPTYYTA